MNKDTLIEVVNKLTGFCEPAGDSYLDEERAKNLELKIELVDSLLTEIVEASYSKDRVEGSVKEIGNKAFYYIESIQEWLTEVVTVNEGQE